jgi:DNA-binding XRE family transcriptional regulator
MPHKRKIAVRITRPLTEAEQKQVERPFTQDERNEIIARGRRYKRQRDASVAALRETFKLLREERHAQGVTLSQLQERTGITRGALSRLENDPEPNPTLNTLRRYAAALGKQIVVQLADA